ncbi:transcriptional regulator [Robertmurraya yapensis]|uniref:Transcriptional regulator n=2 Tax=Bacillaceae TaxID=186817 RepID=A0A3S0KJJ0_9BACI|nr:transcriptional regulator [Bacillus yapensis]RTR31946.1 transcriptional regulator [Bacillus yapensis]TKS95960.1 transcriptional regulator [Bacillus yapensis]
METVVIEQDIKVLYVTAVSFPEGIEAAHERLHEIIPYSKERRYFGLSRPENGLIVYRAAAEQFEQEKDINCESLIIKKGKYRTITVPNYKNDLQKITKVFDELISYSDIDPNGYCVEWYVGNEDMKCMVRLKDDNLI